MDAQVEQGNHGDSQTLSGVQYMIAEMVAVVKKKKKKMLICIFFSFISIHG